MTAALRHPLHRVVFACGVAACVMGVLQAVVWHQPHFYSAFSVGMAIVLYYAYWAVVGRRLFAHWTARQIVAYALVTLAVCIVIDMLGMQLGYWQYPAYHGWLDSLIKFTLEYAVPFQYLLFGFLLVKDGLQKQQVSSTLGFIAALLAVTFMGLITQYLDHCATSWVVTSMPVSNYRIGSYFVVFQTIGYWLMALIPWRIYVAIDRLRQ